MCIDCETRRRNLQFVILRASSIHSEDGYVAKQPRVVHPISKRPYAATFTREGPAPLSRKRFVVSSAMALSVVLKEAASNRSASGGRLAWVTL